jgi:hypothetical protein
VSRAYSERFIGSLGLVGTRSYVVPAGRRAVVRSLTYASTAPSGQYIQLHVAGLLAYTFTSPGSTVNEHHEVRLVAYAGESVTVYTSNAGFRYAVNGYLFDDYAGPPAAALREAESDPAAPVSG